MKIGFGSMDWANASTKPSPGGAGWYRMHLPHLALKGAGVDTVVGRLVYHAKAGVLGVREWKPTPEEEMEATHLDCDIVVLQRWMEAGLAEDVREARSRGQIVVNDVDDWFWGIATENVAHRILTEDPAKNITHYRAVLCASDVVVCSTPYLGERVRQFVGDKVTVVRNAIDLDRWEQPYADRLEAPPRVPPVLGWAGAVPWRSGDLETMRGFLPGIVERHDLPFHHSGHLVGSNWPTAGEMIGLPKERCTETDMAPIGEWPDQLRHIDIGVVPLSDRPFNRAKSAIKGMEYAAAGVPFVAYASPEYVWLHQTHGIGRIARKPREWIRHLDQLASMTPEERAAEAATNRERLAPLRVEHLARDWLAAVVERVKAA